MLKVIGNPNDIRKFFWRCCDIECSNPVYVVWIPEFQLHLISINLTMRYFWFGLLFGEYDAKNIITEFKTGIQRKWMLINNNYNNLLRLKPQPQLLADIKSNFLFSWWSYSLLLALCGPCDTVSGTSIMHTHEIRCM